MEANASRGPKVGREALNSTTLRKSMAFLETLAEAGTPLGLSELVQRTGLPKSTSFRILSILANERLIHFDAASRTYRIGYRFMSLAFNMWHHLDLRRAAVEEMRRLGKASGENIHLAVLDGNEIVFIDRVESHKILRLHSAIGNRASVHCTALGKSMVAFLPQERQAEIVKSLSFEKIAEKTITDPARYERELRKVRSQGYALAFKEHQSDVCGVASPIRDFRGEIVGSVCISAPVFRTDRDRLEGWAPQVVEAAQTISRNLGWMEA